jgi:hypothetical protein
MQIANQEQENVFVKNRQVFHSYQELLEITKSFCLPTIQHINFVFIY